MDILGYNQDIIIGYHHGYFLWIQHKDKRIFQDNQIGLQQGYLWATSGPEALRDSERTYASTHAHLGTTGRWTGRGPRAASGPEEQRDSEWSHGCPRDTVTVCFQSCTSGHG
jgi:hypothetical protein